MGFKVNHNVAYRLDQFTVVSGKIQEIGKDERGAKKALILIGESTNNFYGKVGSSLLAPLHELGQIQGETYR